MKGEYTVTLCELIRLKQNKNASVDSRVAYRSQSTWDYTVKVFPSRESMAKTIRKEQENAPRYNNWVALIPLEQNEGY